MRDIDIDFQYLVHYSGQMHKISALAIGASVAGWSLSANASPHQLPYTYPYELETPGGLEIENYIDVNPVRVATAPAATTTQPSFDYTLFTEFEYGLSDHFELGLYVVFEQTPPPDGSPASLQFDGVRQRIRWKIGEEGDLPVDMNLYFEVSEMHDELEVEQKWILQKRFGALRFLANFAIEEDHPWPTNDVFFEFEPSGGFAYEFSPIFSAGLEFWGNGRIGNSTYASAEDTWNNEFHGFLGPAVHLNFGKFWWTTGLYTRLDNWNRGDQVGDTISRFNWRTIIALNL
jgi:hypothetical protein